MKKAQEQIERLRTLVRKCYGAVFSKGGDVPEDVSERTVENLPSAIGSIKGVTIDLVATENDKEYLPADYGVDGFGSVKTELRGKVKLLMLRATTTDISNECLDENGRWLGAELLDTSIMTNVNFNNMTNLKYLNCSNWDTSNFTNMSYFLRSCSSIEYVDVSNFNTSKVTDMSETFRSANGLKMVDLRNWNVSNVTTANRMFWDCKSLSSLIGYATIEEVLANSISCMNGLRVGMLLDRTSNLDRASLRALINGLADLTGQTAQTLTLGATLMTKLTEEDIAIATSKNWTLS